MIKKLHLLVVKSYIGPLVLTFFIAEFVLIMHFLWLYIGDLVGKGLEWSVISELLLYASAGLVKMALPLAILLASIMTFGNFGEHFELSAMKSAGISLQRIMKPLIIFSIIISIGSFFFSNYVIPYTNLKMGSLLYDISSKRPEMNIKPGIFNKVEDFTIKIKSRSTESNMMYGFMVYDHREKRGNTKVSLADSGTMEITGNQKHMIITLYGGKSYEEVKETDGVYKKFPETHYTFDKETIIFEMESSDLERTDEQLFKHHYQMKRLDELIKSKDSLTETLENRKVQFINGLNRTKYFKYERKIPNLKDSLLVEIDSARRVIPVENMTVVMDLDSLLQSFSTGDKQRIFEMTLENAENARRYIESNQQDLYEREKTINKHFVAYHEKFTLSIACLIFFFIGAPLGAIIRKGGFGLPFLVSVIFFLLYYVVSLVGKKFVEEGIMSPWQGMWLSSFITMPLGVFFTYKATTDSVLFDASSYFEFIKRPFKVLEIRYKDPEVVFHKDIELPESELIISGIKDLINSSSKLKKWIDKDIKTRKSLYKRHFVKQLPELKAYIEEYDALYSILAVKFRERKFYRVSLEKFPRIDFDKYDMSKRKLNANYALLTIGIFPIGILLLLRSYIKLKVLKQKIELVQQGLKTFDDPVAISKELKISEIKQTTVYQPPKTVSIPVPKPSFMQEITVTDEQILEAIADFRTMLQQKAGILSTQLNSFFEFLRLLLTKDISYTESLMDNYANLKRLIRRKFADNRQVRVHALELPLLHFDKYRMNYLKIYTNYLLLGFLPVPIGALVFWRAYNKLSKLMVKFQTIETEILAIEQLIVNKKYNEPEFDDMAVVKSIFQKDIEQITDNEVKILLEKIYEKSDFYSNLLSESKKSFFVLLRLILSKEANELSDDFANNFEQVYNILKVKYSNNEKLYPIINTYPRSGVLKWKMTDLLIYINYMFLTILPVGMVVFLFFGYKLKIIGNKIRFIHQKTNELLASF